LNGYQRARFTDPYDDNYVPIDTHRFVGSSEESNYVAQKSLGGHRVKFILETGKPDHVHGSYDDIRIEKMERERIERIESGKNLEVTNMTGDKGGRKCLLFCAAMLVLTGSVIVAGLYGSGKLRKITDYGQGIQSSELSGGGSSQVHSTTSPVLHYVPNAIEVKFKIDNHNFTNELTDEDSETFKELANALEEELSAALFSVDEVYNGKARLNLKILKFEPGSIICTFRIGWTYFNEQDSGYLTAPVTLSNVKERLEAKAVNGYIYFNQDYRVPPNSIVVEKLLDKCLNNQSLCSHECRFSRKELRFACYCPDHLHLFKEANCVDPSQSTTTSTSTTTEITIKEVFNKVFNQVGNATFVSIKSETTEMEVEEPPKLTDDEAKETSATSIEPGDDTKVKPEEGFKADVNSTSTTTEGTMSTESLTNVTTEGESHTGNATGVLTATEEVKAATNVTDAASNVTDTTIAPVKEGVSIETNKSSTSVGVDASTNVTMQVNDTVHVGQQGGEFGHTQTGDISKDKNVTFAEEGEVYLSSPKYEDRTESGEPATVSITQTTTTEVTTNASTLETSTEGHTNASTASEAETSQEVFVQPPIVEGPTNVTRIENGTLTSDLEVTQSPEKHDANKSDVSPDIYVSPGTRLEDIAAFKYARSNKTFIVQDLSALMPGDSPGDVRLQDIAMSEELFNQSSEANITLNTSQNTIMSTTEVSTGSPVHNGTTDTHSTTSTATTSDGSSHNENSSVDPINTAILFNNETKNSTIETSVKKLVIVTANNSDEIENVTPREVQDNLHKEVVTVDAIIFDGNPVVANKTPPPVRTTTTSTTTPVPPIFTEYPKVTDRPPKVSVNRTSQTVIINSVVNISGEESKVAEPDPSLLGIDFGIIFNASSDLGSMLGNTTSVSGDSSAASLSTTTTTPLLGSTITTSTLSGVLSYSGELTEGKSEDAGLIPVNDTDSGTPSNQTHIQKFNKDLLTTTVSSVPPAKLLCNEDQLGCVNGTSSLGRCIPRSAHCNSVPDCSDLSDEHDCRENNCFGNFQCLDGECIERQYVCDGVTNCRDGDDELNCDSWQCRSDEFRCGGLAPSPCIPISLQCDGQPDCSDHSDEVNCSDSCPGDAFRCPEGWCIPLARTCDGKPDCHSGEDEKNCGCSGLDETPCGVGGCVPTFHLCDGLRQCQDGSDEWHCLRIDNSTRQLEVRSGQNRWMAVCGEGWTSQWSDLVCEQLGAAASLSTEVRRVVEAVPRPRVRLAPKASARAPTPLQFVLKSDCSSDSLVHLACEQHSCGSWSLGDDVLEEQNLSVGARPAVVEGLWPSLALLLRTHPDNNTQAHTQSCTASIVAPSWVLAAYSCLSAKENGMDPGTWAVVSGVASPTVTAQFHYVAKMVPFPATVRTGGLWTGDAVLLRLDTPLVLGHNTQPVCVPNGPPASNALCVVAGWTRSEYGAESESQFLHYLPVPLLGLDACNTTHYPGRLNHAHTCVGFTDAQHAPCHGDEGSPLMCRSETGAWRLEGLLTHHARCGRARHPAVFTALHALQPWLSNTIGTPYV
ncbi:hypothetical protein OTU49_002964, partial [Cherax quadricarinatus]